MGKGLPGDEVRAKVGVKVKMNTRWVRVRFKVGLIMMYGLRPL